MTLTVLQVPLVSLTLYSMSLSSFPSFFWYPSSCPLLILVSRFLYPPSFGVPLPVPSLSRLLLPPYWETTLIGCHCNQQTLPFTNQDGCLGEEYSPPSVYKPSPLYNHTIPPRQVRLCPSVSIRPSAHCFTTNLVPDLFLL